MRAKLVAPGFAALALALASSGASAQTVISRSIGAEPVETTVTQTPTGTIVTRRPVEGGVVQQPAGLPPAIVQGAPPLVATGPDTIDDITTRAVVERAEATRAARSAPARQITTRQVSARIDRADRAAVRSVQRNVT